MNNHFSYKIIRIKLFFCNLQPYQSSEPVSWEIFALTDGHVLYSLYKILSTEI